MVKIALDAGHGFHTPGKRTPDGEREWTFNNKVLLACAARLAEFEGVEMLRLDDPEGKTDVPLAVRTSKANAWKADALVSIHHNANTANWGNWGGAETYVYTAAGAASVKLAELVHSRIAAAMGLRDRGVKRMNLHMVRESNMPAILTEGGFMDSLTDIGALRDDAKLQAQGIAIAEGIAAHFHLKEKAVKGMAGAQKKPDHTPSESHAAAWEWAKVNGLMNGERPKEFVTREQFASVLMKLYAKWQREK